MVLDSPQTVPVLTAIAAGLTLAAIYAQTFSDLATRWSIDPNYSHGWLVPLASGLFAWKGLATGGAPWRRRVSRRAASAGSLRIALGLLIHLQAWFLGFLLLDVAALIVILQGMLLLAGGRRALRTYGFAAGYLIFMAPLPFLWQQPLAIFLQQTVSSTSAALLTAVEVPVLQEGYLLHLPGQTLEVAEACSGLRQLSTFLALALAVGALQRSARWIRVLLALVALPIAVLSNLVRIGITTAVLLWAGPEWAEGVFHTLEGLAVAAVGMGLLLGAAWLLAKLEPPRASKPCPSE